MEKELLLKDLCARLPYGVFIKLGEHTYKVCGYNAEKEKPLKIWYYYRPNIKSYIDVYLEDYRPYLRPMSSMTEEEIYELKRICDENDLRDECGDIVSTIYGMTVLHGEVEDVYPYNLKIKISQNLNYAVLDYLNAHHFDYRGLISMDLALPATDGMYDFK